MGQEAEPPPGFSRDEWERAVRDGRAVIVDPPERRFRVVPRVVAGPARFLRLTVRRLIADRRGGVAGGAESDCPPCPPGQTLNPDTCQCER